MLDACLSKHQYEIIRNATRTVGCDLFLPYYKVLNAKKRCYPDDIDVTESYACVALQALLDHTAERLLQTKSEEEILAMNRELTLLSKWGCDGSSGHSEYNSVLIKNIPQTHHYS